MAQWLCKHGDLHSKQQYPCKKSVMVTVICNSSTEDEGVGTGRSLGPSGQSVQRKRQVPISVRDPASKLWWTAIEEDT